MSRQSTYTEAQAAEICERIAEGEPLRQICRDPHMPAWRTVYAWLAADTEFAARFARARDEGFDAIAEQTLDIVDEVPERTMTQFGDKVDAGYVQWQKNRAEQRLKLLAKWSPKYADKQAVQLSGGLNLATVSDDELEAEIATLASQVGHNALAPDTDPDDASDLV